MLRIGLFYGSSTGTTRRVAETIVSKLGRERVSLHDIDGCNADTFQHYDFLILGTSTWGEGEMQDDWATFLEEFGETDLSEKHVALFGLGDQEAYGDFFLNAMGTLYDEVTRRGADVVGGWPAEGYTFEASTAVQHGEFVGLALDEENQDDLTAARIDLWLELIRPYLPPEGNPAEM